MTKQLTSLADKIQEARACCKEALSKGGKRVTDLFSGDWRVFVIKRDKESNAYITEKLCCERAQ